MAEITVRIGPDGKVDLSVDGVKGPGCADLTRFLEEALGEVSSRELKAEYHEGEQEETVSVEGSEGEG